MAIGNVDGAPSEFGLKVIKIRMDKIDDILDEVRFAVSEEEIKKTRDR